MVGAAALCVTVLVPLGIGYFVMTKTSLLKPDPAMWTDRVRKFSAQFPAYYMVGVVPILLILAVALLWPPLQRRPVSVGVGVAALIGVLFMSSWASGSWDSAEKAAAQRLVSTVYPFGAEYHTCGVFSFDLRFGSGMHEMWQVHSAQQRGFRGDGCNRIDVYKGWTGMGVFTLPDGDTFDPSKGWDGADTSPGGLTLSDVWVNMKTVRGGDLHFTLAGARNS